MRLTPSYSDRPIIAVEARTGGAHAVTTQRARLVASLGSLDEHEWRRPSRCEGWTVQDVVTHLTSTNGFWALSISAGAKGEPTRYLASFDPVASPAQLVAREQGKAPAETLAEFSASCAALAGVVDALDEAGWDAIGEAPPGHLPMRLVADHALWDSWVHERDIVVALGRTPVENADEVVTCLRYSAALGRAFEVAAGGTAKAPVVLEATAPEARVVVEVDGGVVRVHDGPAPAGAVTCPGDAVEMVEMLSMRDTGAPVPHAIGSLTAGLAAVFDQPAPA